MDVPPVPFRELETRRCGTPHPMFRVRLGLLDLNSFQDSQKTTYIIRQVVLPRPLQTHKGNLQTLLLLLTSRRRMGDPTPCPPRTNRGMQHFRRTLQSNGSEYHVEYCSFRDIGSSYDPGFLVLQ